MGGYRRIVVLVLIMTAVATGIGGVAIGVLYNTAFEQRREDLSQTARIQARLMEAVARYDQRFSEHDHPLGAAEATISQIVDAHRNHKGIGETGEFTLARLEGDRIVFLISHRHHDLDMPPRWPSTVSKPNRCAAPCRASRERWSATTTAG